MRAVMRSLMASALPAVVCLLPFAVARAADPADPADEKPPEEARKKEPERVKVESSAPYIPTSNTIATRLPVSLRLTPANVGTVNEPLLRDQYALVLGDALRNVSGVNVQTQSGVTDYFLIRGFDSLSSGLVLTDGALEPEVSLFQMYNVERVEVLKGPGGFLYGRNPLSGALAGAVNIVRRQPVPANFGRVSAVGGSFGTYEGSYDWNHASSDGDAAFRLNGLWRQSNLYRDDKDGDTAAINPAFTYRFSDRSSLNLNLEYVSADASPDSGLPLYQGEIPDVPRTRSYQSPFDASSQTIGRFQADYQIKLSDRWTLRDKAYYRGLDWDTGGTIFNGVFPNFLTGRPEVSRTLTVLDDRQRFVGDQVEAVLTANTGPIGHHVLFGFEAARYGDDFTIGVAGLPSIDLFDPVETASQEPAASPFDDGDSRSIVLAPYALDQMQLSKRFELLVGARLDSLDFQDDATGDSFTDRNVSPMAGVVFSATENVAFYANGGRSYGPPPPRTAGEPAPEQGTQYEAGTKLQYLEGKLQATVAAYQLDRENIGIPDDNGITQQAGDQRSRGVELEFAAEIRPDLRAFLSYAYNDAELTRFSERIIVGFDPITFQPVFATVDRSGNVPAFAPDHILNVWVSKRFQDGLGIGVGGRYVSGQFIAEDNAFAIDSYVTLDAAVYYTVGPWDFSLNLKNLTDADYETRGFGSTSVIPAAPFGIYGGVGYRF